MSWVATAIIGSAAIGALTAPDAPDSNPGMMANAASSEKVGMAQVDLGRETLAAQKERNARLDTMAEQVSQAQLESMRKNDALADDYANYNKTTFRPLEQSLVDEANNYDSPQEQERAAGEAGAAVKKSLSMAKASNVRDMARMGVNPNSGKFAAISEDTAVKGALAEAGAENGARQAVRQVGFARRMDAASLGRNLPSSQATSASIALSAGTNAVNNTAAAVNAGNQTGATVSGIYGGANSSFGTAGGLSNLAAQQAAAIYGTQVQQNNSLMSGLGSGIGMYYGTKKK